MPRSSMAPLARSMAIMDHIMAPDTATNMGKKAPSPAVATPWGRARLRTPMDIMRATIIIWAKGAFGSPAWRSGCPMAGGVFSCAARRLYTLSVIASELWNSGLCAFNGAVLPLSVK